MAAIISADMRNSIDNLRKEVRKLKYPGSIDYQSIIQGSHTDLLQILRYVMCDYSPSLTAELVKRGHELTGKDDKRFLESVYVVLRDELNYKPQINISQFLTQNFASKRMSVVAEVCKLCREFNGKVRKPVVHKTVFDPSRLTPRKVQLQQQQAVVVQQPQQQQQQQQPRATVIREFAAPPPSTSSTSAPTFIDITNVVAADTEMLQRVQRDSCSQTDADRGVVNDRHQLQQLAELVSDLTAKFTIFEQRINRIEAQLQQQQQPDVGNVGKKYDTGFVSEQPRRSLLTQGRLQTTIPSSPSSVSGVSGVVPPLFERRHRNSGEEREGRRSVEVTEVSVDAAVVDVDAIGVDNQAARIEKLIASTQSLLKSAPATA